MSKKLRSYHGKPCFWCKRQMLMESASLQPTRDHLIPRSRGGTVIRITCLACNNLKGDMPPALWVLTLEKHPEVLNRFGGSGPRGMALFYNLFGSELEGHIARIVAEATARFPEYGEARL